MRLLASSPTVSSTLMIYGKVYRQILPKSTRWFAHASSQAYSLVGHTYHIVDVGSTAPREDSSSIHHVGHGGLLEYAPYEHEMPAIYDAREVWEGGGGHPQINEVEQRRSFVLYVWCCQPSGELKGFQ